MVDWMLARARSLATLAVLALLFVIALTWGWKQVTDPLPKAAETPICIDTELDAGDTLRPAGMTVNVLNSGGRDGLASHTMSDLVEHGFGEGRVGDAPAGTQVTTSQIWASDPSSAPVRLVRSYLGGNVEVVDTQSTALGLTIVLGPDFRAVRNGRAQVQVNNGASVCVPTAVTTGAS